MDILLIGSTGSLMRKVVEKLHKEGHRIFMLTEQGKETPSYLKVFETYRFSYDNACIREVFVSVKPAVTLFLGAYDKNFHWSLAMNTAVKYTSGLLNILMSFSALQRGRFIYLTSEEVFEDLEINDYLEVERGSARSEKAQAVAMGEKMCLDYGKMTMGDIRVLRLGNLYGLPEDEDELDNVCVRMCLDALDVGEIHITPGRTIYMKEACTSMDLQQSSISLTEGEQDRSYSLLYLQDAVEYIYLMMTAGNLQRRIYQVSGKTLITQREMAELILEQFSAQDGQEPQTALSRMIEDSSNGENSLVLENTAFDQEFNLHEFVPPTKGVPQVAAYIRRNADRFSRRSDRQESLWKRVKSTMTELFRAAVPFIENLVCFIPFFMMNNRAVDSHYFARIDFYVLYVLLFAVVHGQQQAIFSSLLAIAGYFFRQMYYRTGLDVLLDYNTYVWMAQLLILGLVVGYLKDRLRSIHEEHAGEVEFLSKQLADISDINDSNVRVKDVLSDQLVNQNDSLGKIYEITSELDSHEPEEVLFYAAGVVARVMHCKDVAVYSVENDAYARLVSATSDRARALGNSLQYKEMDKMYQVIRERKVYINKKMEEGYPLMANAIYEGDALRLMIMVWGISWERMTLGQANMLAVTSYLIQNAMLRANRYLEILQSQRYLEHTRILEHEAFSRLESAFRLARKQKLTVCTMVDLYGGNMDLEEINETLCRLVRNTDYVGVTREGGMRMLLANTLPEDAKLVTDRLQEAGIACSIEEDVE